MFQDHGVETAAQYAAAAAQATMEKKPVGSGDLWDGMDPRRTLHRRHSFILSILRQGVAGLLFMHQKQRLHQSLGPNSLILNTTQVTPARNNKKSISLASRSNLSLDDALG